MKPSLALVAVLCATASAQIQVSKFSASDAAQGNRFGQRLASSGDWLMVGTPADDDIAGQSGAVYAYLKVGNTWIETQKLKASDPEFGDGFGWDVAIEGTVCIVGAYTEDPLGIHAAGSCYVFELSGGTWSQTGKIWADDALDTALFGYSVAVSNNRLLIGARQDSDANYEAGAAYVFDRVGSSWVQSAKLTASDAMPFDFFGWNVSLFGDLALIASSSDGPSGGQDQGAAYVFEFNGVTWNQVTKLIANDGGGSDGFGQVVAIRPDLILVGATNHDHGLANWGAVYVFERPNGTWLQTQELRSHDPISSQHFGTTLSLQDDVLLVGATGDGPSILTGRGAAYVLARKPTGWTIIGKATANDASNNDTFGAAIALSGNLALVAAPTDDDVCPSNPNCNSRSVYVFDIAPDARQFGHCASGAPCGNVDKHGGCVNSTGSGATLAAGGSSSVTLDELRFEVRNMLPLKSALVFMGAGQGQSVLGDGLRVVTALGSGLYRYPLRTSDATGVFTEGPGLVAHSQNFALPGHVAPGNTWNFQCWYRDPSGPCGMGTNLTNAVEVIFTP